MIGDANNKIVSCNLQITSDKKMQEYRPRTHNLSRDPKKAKKCNGYRIAMNLNIKISTKVTNFPPRTHNLSYSIQTKFVYTTV